MTVAPRSSLIKVEISQGDVRTIQRGKTYAHYEHLQQGFENTRGGVGIVLLNLLLWGKFFLGDRGCFALSNI